MSAKGNRSTRSHPKTQSQTEEDETVRYLESLINSDIFINKVCDKFISQLDRKLDEVCNKYKERIFELETKITNQQEQIGILISEIDTLNQRSKNKNIRVFGLSDSPSESTTEIVDKLIQDMGITNAKVEQCFRIGKFNAAKKRPILVKFKNYSDKNIVYKNKKLLKNTSTVIKEDLTTERLNIVKEASDKVGYKNIWTNDGIIFLKYNGEIHKVANLNSWMSIKCRLYENNIVS